MCVLFIIVYIVHSSYVKNYKSVSTPACVFQVPMGFFWGDVTEGVRVEVLNSDTNLSTKVYWIAEIVKLAGKDKPLTSIYVLILNFSNKYVRFIVEFARKYPFCNPSSGFKALLRYEGFDTDSSHDFWCNLCVPEIHPVGWCASNGKPLVPPKCKSSLAMRELMQLG